MKDFDPKKKIEVSQEHREMIIIELQFKLEDFHHMEWSIY